MVKHALYSSNIDSLVCLLPHTGAIDVIDDY